MIFDIWHELFYRPLFNLLIWVYNNWTDQNFGWAVVYVTILLRFALLPFTVITEKNKIKNQALYDEVKKLEEEYHSDQVMKKQEIRKVLKLKKVSPWSKVFSIGFQALFVILLYEVFKSGLFGRNLLDSLYTSVDYPGVLNTTFFGFELGLSHTYLWPGMVAALLAIEIFSEYRKRAGGLQKRDLMFFIIFPLFVFFLLWMLPMVKSLFFIVSMFFTYIVSLVLRPFVKKTVEIKK
ncbi:MAG: YidC/Oxa1 family membrane protein insertase [Candidatus Magasanikbacteria bacterium]